MVSGEMMGFSLRINGEVVAHDANNDGTIEANEIINQDDGTQDIIETTEMKEALDALNKDDVDVKGKSSMDLRARLHYMEIAGMMGLDTLAMYHMVSSRAKYITESKKRLSVSLNGEGRKEIVAVTTGDNQGENSQASMGKRLMQGLFGSGKKKEESE
jgi:hypothetical protein